MNLAFGIGLTYLFIAWQLNESAKALGTDRLYQAFYYGTIAISALGFGTAMALADSLILINVFFFICSLGWLYVMMLLGYEATIAPHRLFALPALGIGLLPLIIFFWELS